MYKFICKHCHLFIPSVPVCPFQSCTLSLCLMYIIPSIISCSFSLSIGSFTWKLNFFSLQYSFQYLPLKKNLLFSSLHNFLTFIHSIMCVCMLSHVQLFAPLWTVACQHSLSMGFFRQEYWSGLPFSPLGNLSNPGIKPVSPVSPALQTDSLPTELLGNPLFYYIIASIFFPTSHFWHHRKFQSFPYLQNMLLKYRNV